MRTLRFDIVTIFPGMFAGVFDESLIRRARDKGILDIRIHDLRQYTLDKHRRVDDYPFGGGVGVVMSVEPIARALDAIRSGRPRARVYLLSPSGERLTQELARQLAGEEEIILVCGRYEGVDARIAHFIDGELSIGDYVLPGGEIPAMVVVETVARLVPGVVGDAESLRDESFSAPLLEYPQYTRPREFRGHLVPEVLLSGNHAEIEAWKREQAEEKTARRRPDLMGDDTPKKRKKTSPRTGQR